MKILLSAYSCSPGKGSEFGVGWNWAINLGKLGHQVWVITRNNNRIDIETEYIKNRNLPPVNFIYFELPNVILKIKKQIGVHLYYELWQYHLYKKMQSLHDQINFDLVHHITFGVLRQPSYLYKLNIPFIFGPVGGGEYTPLFLIRSLPLKSRVWEYLREKSNYLLLKRKAVIKCFNHASLIISKTEETAKLLGKYQFKTLIIPEIGIEMVDFDAEENLKPSDEFNILFVGRLLHWKGVHLAIKSFHKFNQNYPNSTLTVIGNGPFLQVLKNIVIQLNLIDKVIFKGSVHHSQLNIYYKNSKVFLFPSLHDSSGNVVLEAMSNNLPVVALALGGPKIILGKDCPTLITINQTSEYLVIQHLADMLSRLYIDKHFYQESQKWTKLKIAEYQWKDIVEAAYYQIEKYI